MGDADRVIDYDQGSFPEATYLAAFPDVAAVVQQGVLGSGFEHYARFGREEIRSGARRSPFGQAPPARRRVEAGAARRAGAAPFLMLGAPAARAPSAPPATRPALPPARPAVRARAAPGPEDVAAEQRFVEALYLAMNPDVAEIVALGVFPSGLEHWRELGREEERQGLRPTAGADVLYGSATPPPPEDVAGTEGFDAAGYLHLYPDVRQASGGDPGAALAHWQAFGRAEGRSSPGVAPYAGWRLRIGAMLQRPFGLNVYGPFAATSGLGTAARGLVRAIAAAGLPFELHPYDVSHGPPRVLPQERARSGRYRVNLLLANADQVAALTALYPRGRFEDAYNIAVWAWELAAFRPDWYGAFAALDEVWTNSAFECRAIGAVAPVPVHTLHLPVEVTSLPARARDAARDGFGIPRERFVFLVAFDVGSTAARKNPQAVIAAFREAFPAGPSGQAFPAGQALLAGPAGEASGAGPAGRPFLVIKFHASEIDPAATRALHHALRGLDDVLVIAERLTPHRMAALQAACDCLVSAHRSEGFGLNIAEFMALGKPVIATAYSGNLEFFDAEVGFPVEYRLVEVERVAGPYMPGYVWAEPSHASLVAQLRAVQADRREAAARAERARARMEAHFTPQAVGAALRARLLALGLDAEPPPFLRWIGASRGLATPTLLSQLSAKARHAFDALAHHPVLSLVVPVFDVKLRLLQACVASVQAQSYPLWELCLCDDASTDPELRAWLEALRGTDPRIRLRRLPRNLGIAGASNAAAEMATGEFLLMLDNDDTLAPDALLETARALDAERGIDVLYCDEDKIDAQGAFCEHFYKPDWSPEHLESVMYVLHMLSVRKSLFLRLGGFRAAYSGAQDYDLMLRLSRETDRVHHLPKVLYHWRKVEGSSAALVDAKPYALEAGRRALADHAAIKYGPQARVEPGLLPGTFRLRRPILGTPRVTLVILTDNAELALPGRRRFRMVDGLVQSVLQRTAYPNYEILVVDNGRLSAQQATRLAAAGVRVVDYTGPVRPFNYAAKCNFAIRQVQTEHLVLLNDDMEVMGAEWLTALMELIQDPGIGAVGGRLLHADGTLQHVGTVIGVNEGSAHLYHSFPADFVGYNGFTHVIRNYSAVTGACLATRRGVLTRVGGLDESFALDFNDTDLCLKIVEAGFRVAYTPYCEMLHFESRSAVRAAPSPDEKRRFGVKWRKYLEADPYYNVNLSRTHADLRLRE